MEDPTNSGSVPPDGGPPPADPPRDPHDLLGTELADRYRIVGKLGEGAMGAVWVGEHIRMGRRDAIKVLRGALAGDSDSIARFHRGARNLSAIRHPNVCTLYDYGETSDGSPFLALELIDGESLKELVDREGALELRRALSIARQIAGALQAAHDAGIVHRDLKPGNVMIERSRSGADIAKVVDFDIAKGPEGERGEEVTQLGFVVGTPEYMSPEQLMGDRLDGRSDVYSLGLVLFRMLTGDLPFRGGSTHEVMVQRLTTKPLTLDEVAAAAPKVDGLQDVLDRALALELDRRYTDAAGFGADLDRLLAGAPPEATTSAPVRATPAPPRAVPETVVSTPDMHIARPTAAAVAPASSAKRWWIAAAAVIVLAGGGGTAWLMTRGDGETRAPQQPEGGAALAPDSQGVASTAAAVDSPQSGDPQRNPRPASAESEAGGSGQQATLPGQVGGETTPPADPPPAVEEAGIVISPADTEMLFRQFDKVEASDPGMSRATIQATIDTAMAFYEYPGAQVITRANAALALGAAYLALGNRSDCERWATEADRLRPGNPVIEDLLTRCRSNRP